MKLLIARRPLRSLLRWTQRAMFVSAAAVLSYCAYRYWDAWMFQKTAGQQLDLPAPPKASAPPSPLQTGALIGRLSVSRLGLAVVIIEGVDKESLHRAAGHIPGTALPGQPGNSAISAHRDTFFRPLRNVRLGDIIDISTQGSEFHYRVVSTKIVAPSDVSVLAAGPGEVMTLVTCYPFYFIGPAPKRFIVRAERTFHE
jgi:sortase A